MLDRKTKDRDASVELLEDRIKQNGKTMRIFLLGGTLVMLLSMFLNQIAYFYNLSTSTIAYGGFIFILGISLFGLCMVLFIYNSLLGNLIYLKQHFDGGK